MRLKANFFFDDELVIERQWQINDGGNQQDAEDQCDPVGQAVESCDQKSCSACRPPPSVKASSIATSTARPTLPKRLRATV
jgi:hypothetical protein